MQGGDYWQHRLRARLGRRRALGLALAGSSSVALSAACGARKPASSTSSPGAANAEKPHSGGTFNLAEFNDFFDFDPTVQGSSLSNWDATMQGYDTLLDFDRDSKLGYADIVVKPRLVQRWETPDAQTYTLHLQPGVHFADAAPVNGRALSSADVKWTLEYLSRTGAFTNCRRPTTGFALSGLNTVETPDDATVVVRFSDAYAPFLNYLTTCTMPVLAHEILDQDGNFRNRMVGTGPYQLDTSATQKGSQWIFKKNATYWEQGHQYLDRGALPRPSGHGQPACCFPRQPTRSAARDRRCKSSSDRETGQPIGGNAALRQPTSGTAADELAASAAQRRPCAAGNLDVDRPRRIRQSHER